jgi:para-aminobenzoate synthetase component 1
MNFNDINILAKQRKPFLFISDFKAENLEIILLEDLENHDIEFSINEEYQSKKHSYKLETFPIDFQDYKKKFDFVIQKIESGETYILNLTQETEIKSELTLKEMYSLANAHYKLRYKDEFICFSPEKFVQIRNDKIDTFPMKGTIDASIPYAKEKILNNKKEMAEHIMVVDLLRNDLSIVATNVRVKDFRYIKEIEAGEKKLLQVSSHIRGDLNKDWHNHLGDILKSLLPAGSITGTPKKSTVEIIERVEDYNRGFFTGVFGVFDGESLDSGVMIRFIEKNNDRYIYKSGGGITIDSIAQLEYEELNNKIYLP